MKMTDTGRISPGRRMAAAVACVLALAGCRDDVPVPPTDEPEESEIVLFDVRNSTDGWAASRAGDELAESDRLPVMDSLNIPYPALFIQKNVDYPARKPTLEPYKNPYYEGSTKFDIEDTDKGVELFPGATKYKPLSMGMEVTAQSERYGRLKVIPSPMTERSLGELRALGAESRRKGGASRSTIADETNVADLYANIGVSAVCYDGTLGWGYGADRVKTIDNELVSRSGNRWQTTVGKYYWNVWGEDYNRVRFFAYAPYGTPGLVQADDDPDDGTPRFSYSVAPEVENQVDLGAIAVTTPGNFHRTVPLRFDHILSGVRFLVDDSHMASCLKSITISGIHGAGTYKYSLKPYDFTDPDDTGNPNINPDNRPGKPGVTPGDQEIEKGTWTPVDPAQCSYSLSRSRGDFYDPPTLSQWSQDHPDGDKYWCVTEPDRIFFLLPQDLPESATIEAVFEDDGEIITMVGRIGGKDAEGIQRAWEQGVIYTYVITTYDIEYVLKLVKEGGEYPYPGGFDNKTVVSYARYYDKSGNLRKIVPLDWTPVFYNRNGEEVEAPDWYSVTYDRPAGLCRDYRPEAYADVCPNPNDFDEYFARYLEDEMCWGTVTVKAQTGLEETDDYRRLKEAPYVGTEDNPANLAGLWSKRPDEIVSTSNSYIINQAGYYKIPLVYGNAYRDGAINTACATSTTAAIKNGSNSFQNHLGNPIGPMDESKAWIKNCGKPIKDAAIMTTTAKNAVQLVHLTDDYLTVYVDPVYIDQGSTVVVVRDNDANIMWSWHLWTTPYNPYDRTGLRQVPSESETFDFMALNLGWVSPTGGSGEDRAAYWRPKQNRGASRHHSYKPLEVTDAGWYITKNRYRIKQKYYIGSKTGYCPVYNWGRKDPLMRMVHYNSLGDYRFRALYTNRWLTTHDITGAQTYTLSQGYYFFKNFTPGESVRVPWAIPTAHNLSWRLSDTGNYMESNGGNTTASYYVSWWTGNRDAINRPGPVPLKSSLMSFADRWPQGEPNGAYHSGIHKDYTRYDDLWCIGQDRLGYLSHANGDIMPVKTVYDPCPPGFMVPPNRAFDNLNITTGVFQSGRGYYRFRRYDLDFPGIPFYSARMAHGYYVYTDGLIDHTQYPGVDSENDDVPTDEYPAYSYSYPWTQNLYGNTMTLWTSDIHAINYSGDIIFGSFFNVTGDFMTNISGWSGLASNGDTSQMGGNDPRSPSCGLNWSASGRAIRPVAETIR